MESQRVTVTPKQLMEMVRFAVRNGLDLLITGKPGTGKTEIVEAGCKVEGSETVVDYPSVSDPTDYKGLGWPDPATGTAKFLIFANIKRLIDAGDRRMTWYLDEIGQAPDSVQKALMAPILTKKANGQAFGPNVNIIACTNRREDRVGVTGLYGTIKSRFDFIVELEPSLDDWSEWALSNGQPIEHIAFQRFAPKHLLMTDWKPGADIVNQPSPRTITKMGAIMNCNAPEHLELKIYSGAVGQAMAIEEMRFLKIYRELPNLDQIIINPDGVDIPSRPDVLFATCAGLVARATDKSFDNIVRYANRMKPQFSTMLILDSIGGNKALVNTSVY